MYSIISISLRKIHTSVLDYPRIKTNRGLRIWDFQGYWRNSKWIFWGANEKQCEISRSDQEKLLWKKILVLRLKIFVGVTQFCGISTGEALFCLESPAVKEKPKNSRGFSKTFVLNPPSPLFVFFCNSPLWYWLNRGEHPCMGGKTPPLLQHS